ncbi:MAG: hypothetical protein ACR2F6_17625 [Mycobacteriales bacterium]
MAQILEHESGLLGLAGTADMRALLGRHDENARLALDVYLHRLASGIAAMTVGIGGLDALVFTGGVGENAPDIRARVAARLAHLDVRVHHDRNAVAHSDGDISATDARVRTLVIASREDLEIAAGVESLLSAARMGRLAAPKPAGDLRFVDKGGLAVALLDQRERELQQQILTGPPPLGPGTGPARRLAAFVTGYLGFLDGQLELVLLSETSTPGQVRRRPGREHLPHGRGDPRPRCLGGGGAGPVREVRRESY